jgi:hypothetical protein
MLANTGRQNVARKDVAPLRLMGAARQPLPLLEIEPAELVLAGCRSPSALDGEDGADQASLRFSLSTYLAFDADGKVEADSILDTIARLCPEFKEASVLTANESAVDGYTTL